MLQELTLEFLKDCTFCATAQTVSYSAATVLATKGCGLTRLATVLAMKGFGLTRPATVQT
jgi:hypothetical protein